MGFRFLFCKQDAVPGTPWLFRFPAAQRQVVRVVHSAEYAALLPDILHQIGMHYVAIRTPMTKAGPSKQPCCSSLFHSSAGPAQTQRLLAGWPHEVGGRTVVTATAAVRHVARKRRSCLATAFLKRKQMGRTYGGGCGWMRCRAGGCPRLSDVLLEVLPATSP